VDTMRVMRAPADGGSAASAGAGASAWQTTKLMSPQLELATDELRAMLGDTADFTVVGVLGSQGVGKSTIMSLLAGAAWHEEPASAAPAGGSYTPAYAVGGEAGTAACAVQCGLADAPFLSASLDARLRAEHGTVGIDVAVTPERLILLDTQPLLSASVLLAMQGSALPPNAQSHENLHEVQALQLAMLVLSVCHVVVLVQVRYGPHGVRPTTPPPPRPNRSAAAPAGRDDGRSVVANAAHGADVASRHPGRVHRGAGLVCSGRRWLDIRRRVRCWWRRCECAWSTLRPGQRWASWRCSRRLQRLPAHACLCADSAGHGSARRRSAPLGRARDCGPPLRDRSARPRRLRGAAPRVCSSLQQRVGPHLPPW